MTTKHTPGPWNSNNGLVITTKNKTIAQTSWNAFAEQFDRVAEAPDATSAEVDIMRFHDCGPDYEESRANAALIAAAPELLEKLEQLVQWLDDSGLSASKREGKGAFAIPSFEYSVVTEARNAIRKATGEA